MINIVRSIKFFFFIATLVILSGISIFQPANVAAAECLPGASANDPENPCDCSAPKTIVGERSFPDCEECAFGNLYCVAPCTNGARVYSDSNDYSPSCSCSGSGMSVTSNGYCVNENQDEETGGGGGGAGGPVLGPNDGITNDDFDAFNPLKMGRNINDGTGSEFADQLSTPGGIISRLLMFAFPIAGMILFVMIVWGGFEMMYGASNTSKAIEAGRNRVTTSIIGFILLFASYWIVQILEVVLGIVIF